MKAGAPSGHGRHSSSVPHNLLLVALRSQQVACVRVIVDALVAGLFSKASVMAHSYDAVRALIHDPQVDHSLSPIHPSPPPLLFPHPCKTPLHPS